MMSARVSTLRSLRPARPASRPSGRRSAVRVMAMGGKKSQEKIFGMPIGWWLKDSVEDGVGSELSTKGDGGYTEQFTKELEEYQRTYTKMLKAAGGEYTVNYQQELLAGKSRDKKKKPYKNAEASGKFMKK
ncbi:hypothetical protein NFJ02_07g133110 [Pycnococcus provasolii]